MNALQHPPGRGSPVPRDIEAEKAEQKKKWQKRISRLFGRDDQGSTNRQQSSVPATVAGAAEDEEVLGKPRGGGSSTGGLRFPRQVIPGLPRAGTFKRQMSEKRERLSPSHVENIERRTLSVDRRRDMHPRAISPALLSPRISAPAIYEVSSSLDSPMPAQADSETLPQQPNMDHMQMQRPTEPPTPPPDEPSHIPDDPTHQGIDAVDIQAELEDRWILNLSMHFRDKSPREKFFITYAETPTRWRRVTVSCDYRNAPPESLEAGLQHLQYQRDKSARIYEAIRSSLLDIQFYETVTNLRLETSADDRLHVHVTEDVNEIIPYPDRHLLHHLDYTRLKRVSESQVHFISHMSGFVYKVRVGDEILIKKEIPGPDSVEEFLYEINALNALLDSKNVVQIRGLVYDESQTVITGLLIDYYSQGPMVDVLFDYRGQLSWERRAKWATQIIQGLGEIHEAGYVQGDFTVSNICVDGDDNVRIIDINRRGCPVGWEPPEIARMIDSGQRISMYIGIKSDLFQLGMVLWAIAMEDDEPERRKRPLQLPDDVSLQIPSWFSELTHLCLQADPRARPSASSLLSLARQPSSLSLAKTRRTSSAALSGYLSGQNESGMRSRDVLGNYPGSDSYIPYPTRYATGRRRSISSSRTSSYEEEEPRGRSPPRNASHVEMVKSFARPAKDGQVAPEESIAMQPEILSIDPTGSSWRDVNFNGQQYYMHVDAPSPPPASNGLSHPDRPRDNMDATLNFTSLSPVAPASSENAEDDGCTSLQDIPEAPQVPCAMSFHPSFRHIDSGIADMHLSPIEPAWRRDVFGRDERRSSAGSELSYQLRPFHHQDSGLADMEMDITAGIGGNEELQKFDPLRSSGRRTFTMKSTDTNLEQVHEERDREEKEEEEEDVQTVPDGKTPLTLELGQNYDSGGEEDGEHVGGVSLLSELSTPQDDGAKIPEFRRQSGSRYTQREGAPQPETAGSAASMPAPG